MSAKPRDRPPAVSSAHSREGADAGLWREGPFPCARIPARLAAALEVRVHGPDRLGSRNTSSLGSPKAVEPVGIARQARRSGGPSNAPRSPGPLRPLGPVGGERPAAPPPGAVRWRRAGACPTPSGTCRRPEIPLQAIEKVDSAPGNPAPIAANGKRRQDPARAAFVGRATSRRPEIPPQSLEKIDSAPGNPTPVRQRGDTAKASARAAPMGRGSVPPPGNSSAKP